MAVEMAASRLLAPYFGTSIIVWANIIGVILAALSIGYFWGGRIAVKNRNPRRLFLVIFITGVFINAVPFIGKAFLTALVGHEISGSLIAILLLFFAPFLLLGMVSPWAIHLATKKIEEVGSIAGIIYGVSTIGSIIGVFLPVFAMIPFIGTQKTIILFGTALVLLGLIGMSEKIWLLLGLFCISAILFFGASWTNSNPEIIASAESLYNFLSVRQIGDSVQLQVNEGRGIQSVYNPNRVLVEHYWDYAAIPPILNPQGSNFLIVGLGAGTSSRILNYFFPNLKITGVEIDPKIIDLGRDFFNLSSQNVDFKIEDGRAFLAENKEKFDFIMVDVYANEYVIPFHLATKEFFELAKQNLSADGIIFMNVAQFGQNPRLLEAVANTFSSVFKNSYAVRVSWTKNILFFAFQNPRMLDAEPKIKLPQLKSLYEKFASGLVKIGFNRDEIIFTDDKAPVELYTY